VVPDTPTARGRFNAAFTKLLWTLVNFTFLGCLSVVSLQRLVNNTIIPGVTPV